MHLLKTVGVFFMSISSLLTHVSQTSSLSGLVLNCLGSHFKKEVGFIRGA
jgi:hypothetical protein